MRFLQFLVLSTLSLVVWSDVSHIPRTYLPTSSNALTSSDDRDLISTETNDLTPPPESNDFGSPDASLFLRNPSHYNNQNQNHHHQQQQQHQLLPNRPILQSSNFGGGYYNEYIGIVPVKPAFYGDVEGIRSQYYNPGGNRPYYVFKPLPTGVIGGGSVIATNGGYVYGKKK